ncbi:MAG: methylthioadenosine phosphorylase [Deltaproteobacteria bacterium GWA2_57_13]|nr:MAG: methylthioadenosine phosphorylase [Deltaproteobacteria bacterium GWA2_57_13]OGQ77242.1 MAG: methylthioadenosine phosphorylase [Deltaproteobacteria bacterium RIFCSPLOWO2_12_FULL_57_22]
MGREIIGIIGGSGLYQMEGLKRVREVRVSTPFGKPSDAFVRGMLDGTELIFLPRHGRGHRWLPTELNFRANIFGMKKLGVERIISVSAVGSLREEIAPGHVVIPDQFIDRTTQRPSSFFGQGIVAHVSFADPLCPALSQVLARAGEEQGAKIHPRGTYLCMEGPQFSTRAESLLYRSWGAHVIGMTNLQEAKLAREAEICFATLALATDYDCWNQTAADVEIEQVLRVLKENVELAQRMIRRALSSLPRNRSCPCASALQNAVITDRAKIPKQVLRDLKPILGKYL